jgi:hypothetical protein
VVLLFIGFWLLALWISVFGVVVGGAVMLLGSFACAVAWGCVVNCWRFCLSYWLKIVLILLWFDGGGCDARVWDCLVSSCCVCAAFLALGFFVQQASLAFVAFQGSLFFFFKGVCPLCLNMSVYLTIGSPALFYYFIIFYI